MTRPSAIISDAQEAVKGTAFTLAVDFRERDGQAFTIASATLTIYDRSDDTAVSTSLTDVTATVSDGDLTGEKRVSYLIPALDMDFGPGEYYATWSLSLGDGQTRKVREALRITEV